jgi:hypothetical protein
MADITYDSSSSVSPISYTQMLLERDSISCYRNVFQQLLDKYSGQQNNNTLNNELFQLHGISQDEIDDIQQTNHWVTKGRLKLSKLMQEYDTCVKHIDALNDKIKDVENKMHQFELYYRRLIDIDTRFGEIILPHKSVHNLKTSILEDLESQLASVSIEKDRIEAIILSLSQTYNVLRTTPLVHICPICMNNDVDTFLDPCGHTICHECISNKFCNSSKFCYMCRTHVRGIRRLYYSS